MITFCDQQGRLQIAQNQAFHLGLDRFLGVLADHSFNNVDRTADDLFSGTDILFFVHNPPSIGSMGL